MSNEVQPIFESDYIPRPVVVLIGEFDGVEEAFVRSLEANSNVAPLLVDNPEILDTSDHERLKLLVEGGFVASVIFLHSHDEELLEYDLDSFKQFESKVPIFIYEKAAAEKINPDFITERQLNILTIRDTDSFKTLRDVISQWRHPTNYFGVEDATQLVQTVKILADIGQHTHNKEENSIPVDPNTATVTQALRMSITPPETRYSDLENHSPTGNVGEEVNPLRRVIDGITRYRNLPKGERESLIKELNLKLGWEVADTGGIYVRSTSRGRENSGFAYDSISGINRKYRGYGSHQRAVLDVSSLVDQTYLYKELLSGVTPDDKPNSYDIESRLYKGYIVPKLTGFELPFAMVWGDFSDKTSSHKAISFIMEKYGAIPVDAYGNLLELEEDL